MQIALRIDGKEKVFSNSFVPALAFRKALELSKKFKDEGIDITEPSAYDSLIEFAVMVFNHQFTVDEVWNGLQVQDLQAELTRIYSEVLSLGGLVPDVESNEEGK